MAAVSQLRFSPLSLAANRSQFSCNHPAFPSLPKFPQDTATSPVSPSSSWSVGAELRPLLLPKCQPPCATGGGDGGSSKNGRGGGDWSGDHGRGDNDDSGWVGGFGPIGALLGGWRSRVAADPEFPFKVLMEELVGVSACVLGDMASRPNFGLNELDFVFSTLVVGSILNFVLMYLLAPTAANASLSQSLPSIFAGCPPGHMFEPGPYGILSRFGTLVYKGTVFAAVGFGAGLVGTAISNGLIKIRKTMDPSFETPNKPPPTVLNAVTWAIHMGISSNFRYQSLNGIEFVLAKGLPPAIFKSSVVILRCLNNVLGGMSFVILARLTGSQASSPPADSVSPLQKDSSNPLAAAVDTEKDKLLATNSASNNDATSE